MPLPRTSALSVLSALMLLSVLLPPAPGSDPASAALPASRTGAVPFTMPASTTCADLAPPLAGTGRVLPPSDVGRVELPDGAEVEVRGGAVVAWASDAPVRAAIVAGAARIHLYWYEPVVTADADLRAPTSAGADAGGGAAVLGVELCRAERAAPDLAEVCIRAGHVPVAGPSTYADGRFDGALGPGFAVEVDPDDGTLTWRSDGTPITAVVTATSTPVLVEYDPPVTSGTDVPFLGTRGTTGRVQLCGGVLAEERADRS